MKNFIIKILVLGFIVSGISGCSDDNLEVNSKYLINSWTESREEGLGIYRPSDFKDFPISRFRQTYKFMDKEECEYMVLSPVDAHYLANGSWSFNERMRTLTIYNEYKIIIHKYKVEELSPNLLHITFK